MQQRHWTEDSTDDFIHKIVGDFVRFIEIEMGDSTSGSDLAKKVGVSAGRVSQVLNNPGNLSLKTIVQFARALGAKVSIVGYRDDDPQNAKGPVSAEVFTECWAQYGKPRDYFTISNCDRIVYLKYTPELDWAGWKIDAEATTNADHTSGRNVTTAVTPNSGGRT